MTRSFDLPMLSLPCDRGRPGGCRNRCLGSAVAPISAPSRLARTFAERRATTTAPRKIMASDELVVFLHFSLPPPRRSAPKRFPVSGSSRLFCHAVTRRGDPLPPTGGPRKKILWNVVHDVMMMLDERAALCTFSLIAVHAPPAVAPKRRGTPEETRTNADPVPSTYAMSYRRAASPSRGAGLAERDHHRDGVARRHVPRLWRGSGPPSHPDPRYPGRRDRRPTGRARTSS